MKDALKRAVRLAGGQRRLGAAIGVSQQQISKWLMDYDGRVPAERAIEIEIAVNGQVLRNELRPDLF